MTNNVFFLDFFGDICYHLKKVWEMISLLTVQPVIIELSGDWTSAVVDVAMLVVTVLSVLCAFFAYGHQKARNKKDTACNLAKHYADSVINKYSDIVSVFVETGISNDIKRLVKLADLKKFNVEEMQSLTAENSKGLSDLLEKIDNVDPEVILDLRMDRVCSVMEREMLFHGYARVEEGKVSIKNGRYLQGDFSEEISSLLNELEWFAMNCRYRLADEKLLYQSLHQTFLSTVWLLYFHISRQNTNNADKLFTNVIWLFVKWRDRLLKITKKAEKRRLKYLKKASAVEAPVFAGKAL